MPEGRTSWAVTTDSSSNSCAVRTPQNEATTTATTLIPVAAQLAARSPVWRHGRLNKIRAPTVKSPTTGPNNSIPVNTMMYVLLRPSGANNSKKESSCSGSITTSFTVMPRPKRATVRPMPTAILRPMNRPPINLAINLRI